MGVDNGETGGVDRGELGIPRSLKKDPVLRLRIWSGGKEGELPDEMQKIALGLSNILQGRRLESSWLEVLRQEGLQGPAGPKGNFGFDMCFRDEFAKKMLLSFKKKDGAGFRLYMRTVVDRLFDRLETSEYFVNGEIHKRQGGVVSIGVVVGKNFLWIPLKLDSFRKLVSVDCIGVFKELWMGFNNVKEFNEFIKNNSGNNMKSSSSVSGIVREIRESISSVHKKGGSLYAPIDSTVVSVVFGGTGRYLDSVPHYYVPAVFEPVRNNWGNAIGGMRVRFNHTAIDGAPAIALLDTIAGELVGSASVAEVGGNKREIVISTGARYLNDKNKTVFADTVFPYCESWPDVLANSGIPFDILSKIEVPGFKGDMKLVRNALKEKLGVANVNSIFIMLLLVAGITRRSVLFPVNPDEGGRLEMGVVGPIMVKLWDMITQSKNVGVVEGGKGTDDDDDIVRELCHVLRVFGAELVAAKDGRGTVTEIAGLAGRYRRSLEGLGKIVVPDLLNALLGMSQVSSLGAVPSNLSILCEDIEFISANSRDVFDAWGVLGETVTRRYILQDPLEFFVTMVEWMRADGSAVLEKGELYESLTSGIGNDIVELVKNNTAKSMIFPRITEDIRKREEVQKGVAESVANALLSMSEEQKDDLVHFIMLRSEIDMLTVMSNFYKLGAWAGVDDMGFVSRRRIIDKKLNNKISELGYALVGVNRDTVRRMGL